MDYDPDVTTPDWLVLAIGGLFVVVMAAALLYAVYRRNWRDITEAVVEFGWIPPAAYLVTGETGRGLTLLAVYLAVCALHVALTRRAARS